jgi:hypothetical protein
MKNEIRVIGHKGKGNKTLCLRGDILTSRGNVLIHFLELSYTGECLNVSSVDIDDEYICRLAGSVNCCQL